MRRKFFGSAGALPSRKNYSPLAVVSARQEPRPPISSTRLNSVLQKRSLLKQAEKLEGASPDAPKIFRQRKSAALQKKLFATRCRFGSAGASPSNLIHATELGATKTKPAEAG
jgi:hypothetical protein